MDLTGLGSIADFAGTLVKRFWPPSMSESEKAQAQIQIQEMLQKREDSLVEAQKSIMVAELEQKDIYVKRARPTIVYAGLAAIFLVHVVLPIFSWVAMQKVPEIVLPDEFWYTWGGVCGAWVLGRSADKLGLRGALSNVFSGGAGK